MNAGIVLLGLTIVGLTACLFLFLFRFLFPNVRAEANNWRERPVGLSPLSARQSRSMFDAAYSLATLGASAQGKSTTDSYDDGSLNGPLVPANCSRRRRLCLTDNDCTYLCQSDGGNEHNYECDQRTMTCGEKAVNIIEDGGGGGDGEPSSPAAKRCDTKHGEYALLQGYNELGVAQWNCLQLYPGWQDPGKRYCEGGTVDMDVRVRVPSYQDCTCPKGSTRIVYSRSQLGQQVYGLPHCVKHSRLYNLGEDYLLL